MRLGVLDVGSNTVHLAVIDAHRGGHPTPMSDRKTTLRLSEHIGADGDLDAEAADALVRIVGEYAEFARAAGCGELMSFATSAVRDAGNGDQVLARVLRETGVVLDVLDGVDEARLTFLAVRRWFGWSAGRIVGLDIGGGSLELCNGLDEDPELAFSLQLGAGRLTRDWFGGQDPPRRARIDELREYLDEELSGPAKQLRRAGTADLAVASSKTFRMLARLAGAAPSNAGPRVPRRLTADGLRQVIAFITRMTAADRAELGGVSAERSTQVVAGALVADAAMRALRLDEVRISPWALREGLILRRLDTEMGGELLVGTR